MPDYLLLMHADSAGERDWEEYLRRLHRSGMFRGGSSIGGGVSVRKTGVVESVTEHLAGFLRIEADDLADALTLLEGHPTLEAGGTVEIRELPADWPAGTVRAEVRPDAAERRRSIGARTVASWRRGVLTSFGATGQRGSRARSRSFATATSAAAA